jgi:exodeoxyribonuclease-1
MVSYLFFDFEVFGVNPKTDRPCQFSAIRTNEHFDEIGPPIEIYCKPANDFLPDIESCLATGITPQIAHNRGIPVKDFFRVIQMEMSRPVTCSVGYNSINSHDEFIRHGLYRNFIDSFERGYKRGSSRFDLLNIVLAMYALRPDSFEWPINKEERVELKLERLAKANGVERKDMGSALSDIRAMIDLTKMAKESEPGLVKQLLKLRDTSEALKLVKIGQPILHVSPVYSINRNYISHVLPIARNPVNPNSIIAYDLHINPDDFLRMTPEEIKSSLSSKEGSNKIPLVEIQINRCPIVMPLSLIRPSDEIRLGIDNHTIDRHIEKIRQIFNLFRDNIVSAYTKKPNDYPGAMETDPDMMLYSGGLFDEHDKQIFSSIRELSDQELARQSPQIEKNFHDPRGPEMLFRYRARNSISFLSATEQQKWEAYRLDRIRRLSADYNVKLQEAISKPGRTQREIQILMDLQEYARQIQSPTLEPKT